MLYRELLLSGLEKEVDRLLYPQPNHGDPQNKVGVKAMTDIAATLTSARESFWPPSGSVVQDNLWQRLIIVRDFLIFSPVNIFSYKLERDLFETLVTNSKIEARTAAIIDLMDRYEGIVEDTHQVLTTSSEQRVAQLLFIIAVIGLFTIYEPVEALFGRGYEEQETLEFWIGVGRLCLIAALFVALYLVHVLLSRRR